MKVRKEKKRREGRKEGNEKGKEINDYSFEYYLFKGIIWGGG